mmetsp:Transcript_36210/g.94183  ORF Transcript_36210/g.94183 Transcript_36210/m.94183 type:complete len:170 (+) Transcript_36210:448-957(+)
MGGEMEKKKKRTKERYERGRKRRRRKEAEVTITVIATATAIITILIIAVAVAVTRKISKTVRKATMTGVGMKRGRAEKNTEKVRVRARKVEGMREEGERCNLSTCFPLIRIHIRIHEKRVSGMPGQPNVWRASASLVDIKSGKKGVKEVEREMKSSALLVRVTWYSEKD